MKKLVFGLVATVMFGLTSNAQQNSNNPYDYVGSLHNEILGELIAHNDVSRMTLPQIEEKVREIATNNQNYQERFRGVGYYSLNEEQIRAGVADYPNRFVNVYTNRVISTEAQAKLGELVNYLLDNGVNMDSKALYAYMTNYEKGVKASKLKEEEKGLILSTASVVRFSNHYWTNVTPVREARSRFWHWFGDAVGAIAGGIAGTYLEPGYGTYAGAVIGAGVVSGSIDALEDSK